MAEDCACIDRVDGVDPNTGGGGPADGTYYNFSYQEGGVGETFISFLDQTSATSTSGKSVLCATQTGSLTALVGLTPDPLATPGDTIVSLYINGSGAAAGSDTQTVALGAFTEFTIAGVAVSEGDVLRFGVDPTNAPTEWVGYVLIGYG